MTDESFRNNCHFYQCSERRVNAVEPASSVARCFRGRSGYLWLSSSRICHRAEQSILDVTGIKSCVLRHDRYT